MTAFGKLVRSTAFRLTLVYLIVFAFYAAALIAYFALNTGRLITEQITETVDTEITYLSAQYSSGGLRRLVLIIEQLATAALETRKQSQLAAVIAQRALLSIAVNAKRRS